MPGAGLSRVIGISNIRLQRHEVITQQIDPSLAEHCERVRHRALSTFVYLSEEEFQSGIRAMEETAKREIPPKPVLEGIDFLVFAGEAQR